MDKIFVNQMGYLTDDVKTAVMAFPCDSVKVVNENGDTVFEASCEHFGFDRCSGDDVYTADFSKLKESGTYRITAGGKCSDSFKIGERVYDKTMYDLMRAFYYLRCGCELKEEHAGKFTHAACHTATAAEWENHGIFKNVTGGWHDAGDYGRYVTPGATALAHLLYAYILFGDYLKSLNLNIPESGGKLPDILAECKYELDWLLKMQCEDGSVYHKATTAQHAPFVMPEHDKAQMYLLPKSSSAAADLAASCALASRVFSEYDAEYAARLLSAAKKSADWLDANSEFSGTRNPEGCGTGEYGESGDRDNRFWAYCELYAATGERKYHDKLSKLLVYDFSRTELGFGSVGGLGTLAYLTCDIPDKDSGITEALKSMISDSAKRLKRISDRCGYKAAMEERSYGWGSNMGLMKNGMIFALADTLCGANEYRSYAKAQFDVLLGVNAVGVSYVTGNGDSAYNYPHLRPAACDGIEECIPGMVSGGPNYRPVEKDARKYIPEGTPPMKCYVDKTEFYSINEITIYWNSPAVFVLSYILSGRQ